MNKSFDVWATVKDTAFFSLTKNEIPMIDEDNQLGVTNLIPSDHGTEENNNDDDGNDSNLVGM